MSHSIVLRAEAQAEFDAACDWYEKQRPGLAVDFVASIQDAFDQIATAPHKFATVHGGIRAVPVRRFPYSLMYRVEEDRVVILAVFHGKRDPGIWQSRN